MKLQVIVSEFGAAANIGGSAETWVKEFELSDEAAAFIKANQGKWQTISFGLSADDRPA